MASAYNPPELLAVPITAVSAGGTQSVIFLRTQRALLQATIEYLWQSSDHGGLRAAGLFAVLPTALPRYTPAVGANDHPADFIPYRRHPPAPGTATPLPNGPGSTTPIQRALWENPGTASRYMCLMEVVSAGAGGDVMVEGISENHYMEFIDVPLSEHVGHGQPSETTRCFEQEYNRAELVRKAGDTNGIKSEYGRNNNEDARFPDQGLNMH